MLRAALVFVAMAGPAFAQAPVHLYLVDTDPPVGSRLSRGEAFYARVQYQTDREIHIWGRGQGVEHTAGKSHPSPVYGPGSGEALIWFTLDVPGTVDVMRIQAVPRGREAAVAQLEYTVKLRWEDNAPKLPRAAWVDPMLVDLQQRVQEHVVSSAGTGWNALATLLFACTPAYLLAQGFAFWRMRGRYGRAFWLPVGAMALVYLVALIGAMAGSNLAPIWVVFASPLALIYVIVLLTFDFRRTSHASGAHR
jgi:hypothetical protein